MFTLSVQQHGQIIIITLNQIDFFAESLTIEQELKLKINEDKHSCRKWRDAWLAGWKEALTKQLKEKCDCACEPECEKCKIWSHGCKQMYSCLQELSGSQGQAGLSGQGEVPSEGGEGSQNQGGGPGEGTEGSQNQGGGSGEGTEGSQNQGGGSGEGTEGSQNQGGGSGEGTEGSQNQGGGSGEGTEGSQNQGGGSGKSTKGGQRWEECENNGRHCGRNAYVESLPKEEISDEDDILDGSWLTLG